MLLRVGRAAVRIAWVATRAGLRKAMDMLDREVG